MKRTTKVLVTVLLASTTSLSAFAGNFLPKETAPSLKSDKSTKELVRLSLKVYASQTTMENIQAKFEHLSMEDSCLDAAWEYGTNVAKMLELPDDGWAAWHFTDWYYETHCV